MTTIATEVEESISKRQFDVLFNREVKSLGGSKATAESFGVSHTFILGVMAGRELPSAKILERFKLAPVKRIIYRYKQA